MSEESKYFEGNTQAPAKEEEMDVTKWQEASENRNKTIFCDIDGTLLKHHGSITKQIFNEPVLLNGVLAEMEKWDRKCYNIILVTGRRESHRKKTEEQLAKAGIVYDQLIMGLGGGQRILINDLKPQEDTPTAVAINTKRNVGIEGFNL